MRYADTPTLIRLNDESIRNDFNQWLTAEFFDDVDRDGLHVLAYAFPHGVRPDSRRTDWPPHYRTGWYAQMTDGSNKLILLDVALPDFDAVPAIEGTRSEYIGQVAPGRFELPAVVALDDNHLLDGATVVAAVKQLSADDDPRARDEIRAFVAPAMTDEEVAATRFLIP